MIYSINNEGKYYDTASYIELLTFESLLERGKIKKDSKLGKTLMTRIEEGEINLVESKPVDNSKLTPDLPYWAETTDLTDTFE
jgi:hypothetical protein